MLQNRRPPPASGDDISRYAARENAYEAQLQFALTRTGSLLLSRIPKGARTIFVVGDGCLQALPFAALRISNGRTTSYALRQYNLYLEPSASVVLYLKQHPAAEKSQHVAIFADPVLSHSDSRLASIQAERADHRFLFTNMQRLTGSAEEAQKILQYLPRAAVTLRTGFDASPDQIRQLNAGDISVLHFATHTVTVSGHPEITGIALSMWNRDGKEQDGVLWLKDIYALHLPLSLVVLSGCRTDGRDSDQGEGLNNLAYAFFFAGGHAIVGSLWSVDDNSTSRLMELFLSRLAGEARKRGPGHAAGSVENALQPAVKVPCSMGLVRPGRLARSISLR